MNITIRGINSQCWKALRIEAVKQDITIGEAINLALHQWLQKRGEKQKKQKSFFELEPFDYNGKDARELSTKVDEVLYGWTK